MALDLKRYDIINALIKKHGYKRYLEIGVKHGETFFKVECQTRHGVDPNSPYATFRGTSDEFFAQLPFDYGGYVERYDIVFVDGLHTAKQAEGDVLSSLPHLAVNGAIVVHDCNPPTEWHQRSYEDFLKDQSTDWNGDVWKAIVRLRSLGDLRIDTIDTDWGCAVIQKGSQTALPYMWKEDLTYTNLNKNRKEWLNLISPEDWLKKLEAE